MFSCIIKQVCAVNEILYIVFEYVFIFFQMQKQSFQDISNMTCSLNKLKYQIFLLIKGDFIEKTHKRFFYELKRHVSISYFFLNWDCSLYNRFQVQQSHKGFTIRPIIKIYLVTTAREKGRRLLQNIQLNYLTGIQCLPSNFIVR